MPESITFMVCVDLLLIMTGSPNHGIRGIVEVPCQVGILMD